MSGNKMLPDFSEMFPDIKSYQVRWAFLTPESKWHQAQILASWTYNRGFREHFDIMEQSNIKSWKISCLRALVDWAFSTVPFYHEKFYSVGYSLGEIRSMQDFKRLPTTTRSELPLTGEMLPELLSSELPYNSCHAMERTGSSGTVVQLLNSYCHAIETTGSSGQPVQMLMDLSLTEKDTLHRMYMFEKMMGNSLDPKKWIYNINHAHFWYTSLCGNYPIFTISQSCPVTLLTEHIAQLKPGFVSCLYSAAEKLAASAIDMQKLGISCLSTNSETSTRKQRDCLEKRLGIPVRDEYSSEEVGLMAFECSKKTYHLLENDTHIELADVDSRGTGRVIATSLWNYAMPIIRYEQGDLAQWPKSVEGSDGWGLPKCNCGSSFRQLADLHGRIDENFKSSVTGVVPSGIMLEYAERWLSHDDSGLQEYRVVQNTFDSISIITVPRKDKNINNMIINNFIEDMGSVFGTKLSVKVIECDQIPNHNKYKRRIFINEMKKHE